MSLVSLLAGRVEKTLGKPDQQVTLAEEFFGKSELVDRYRDIAAAQSNAHVFAPQSLYALMRILIEDAYDAPIEQELTPEERLVLIGCIVAANSITERGIDIGVGPLQEDLLAYELQIGNYYRRPNWLEEMARHRELYRLATADESLASSADHEPVADWIERSGLTAEEQWRVGFGLAALTTAWDPMRHPHIPKPGATIGRLGLAAKEAPALDAISATRRDYQERFAELEGDEGRLIWELRPFNTAPFLRLAGGGLLLLGRPWILSWLGEGFHYRAMRQAQADDSNRQGDRKDHVQRYTAYAGQVFERYCLDLASGAVPASSRVLGEQTYGKGDGKKTSDVAVIGGEDLILFEANARRVGVQPLVTGDPLAASAELTKLLVKKIDQLGVSTSALLSGEAELPDVDMSQIKRVWPVVVAAGHVWQTGTLWKYLTSQRDPEKCKSFKEPKVMSLQVLDAAEYEQLLAMVNAGGDLPAMLARKVSGPYRQRDLAVWLAEDPEAPPRGVRLPALESIWESMTGEVIRALKDET